MEEKYIIMGEKDNNSPNVEVFSVEDNKEQAIKVYNMIVKLKKYFEDKKIKEFENLKTELEDLGVVIFGEDDYIMGLPIDFEVRYPQIIKELVV